MNGEQYKSYKSVMEQYAIKTDDMATEDAYFMATHMPFSQLTVYEGGRTQSAPKIYSEEEVFTRLICNPNNEHRMIIVRGDNGTGKSHLIRFLKAKLESSPATIYNRTTEQVIFLRRLNNSVRGVFSQLIEQNVIKDDTLRQKLQKFIDSSDSKDEASFLQSILYSYIAAVSSDHSGDTYKPVICRDIASYLSDSRVKEYLLREGGAIRRCYTVITAPSNQVLKSTEVFTDEDFDVRKIIRAVINQGDPQASDFASTIKGDEEEIHKLVNYLNHFTSEVVKRCADISSESTKAIFEQLRKDLKKQGKNLTLFVEDFTGFTGIDSELITVLSTEHGGDYADLCRVTSIIGITNDYYDQFRDNFTDRVTHQISVTEDSFGTEEFLTQMAGRYINAIYCDSAALHAWNEQGADIDAMPINRFSPPCKWDSVKIGNHETTLYPFNKKSITTLYDSLPRKSPRMFLKEVIRAQLKEYFDGKIYGDGSDFPLNPGNVQMSRSPHSSAIDRLALSVEDRKRLKAVFALWGDGTASGLKESDGSICFGGINKLFLDDIGLESFKGIGDLNLGTPSPYGSSRPDSPAKPKPTLRDEVTRSYQKHKADIDDWFDKKVPLKFDADYRKWLREFIKGSSAQCGAISWPDDGVPGYIVEQRLSDLGVFYITDQSTPLNKDRAIVFMDRSPLSRDVLLALNELTYAKGWDFEGAAYYQQRLITWLEREKPFLMERVTAAKTDGTALPVIEWCLALQYLRAEILGCKLDSTNTYTWLHSLMTYKDTGEDKKRETKEWTDLIQFVRNRAAEFDAAQNLLVRSVSTTSGAVHYSLDSAKPSCIRTGELLMAFDKLSAGHWDMEQELPAIIPDRHLLYNQAALLKNLYPKVSKAVTAETEKTKQVFSELREYVGEINEENLQSALLAIQDLFATFAVNGIIGNNDIRTKYEATPLDTTREILKCAKVVQEAANAPSYTEKLAGFSPNGLQILAGYVRDFRKIAQAAEAEEEKAQNALSRIGGREMSEKIRNQTEVAREAMINLYSFIETMEVSNGTDRNHPEEYKCH